MDEVVEFCAGLDVHRDTVVATVRFPQGRQRGSETKTFGTDTAELVALGDWLISHQVTRVGLESTGVYWKPVFYLLEDRIEQLWLLNAQHLKNVPGRKTDVVDSAWIAQLVEHGLVRPSFVPSPPIRELRDFTRHRRVLSEERTRMVLDGAVHPSRFQPHPVSSPCQCAASSVAISPSRWRARSRSPRSIARTASPPKLVARSCSAM